MPVMLMMPEDVERWLAGKSALAMQRPAAYDAIIMRKDEAA